MLQKDFHIPDQMIVVELHSLFTITEKKLYYKMRQEHGKHDWLCLKSKIITKWENKTQRFKMENAFESSIVSSDKDTPPIWFLKQKDRLSALNPDMPDSIINIKILRNMEEN
ncbi:hypothetical protein O181_106699 [Austropuccinia psidii MF-1]|uniref:Uncharacterized protein n=1 Tax=Austropuccinia psidii MF-1 TaxID=1389203 RepID=A0A9Q3JRU7_9BASI|nr:hypothetical protein [Austropuccinia psidii MF-1]